MKRVCLVVMGLLHGAAVFGAEFNPVFTEGLVLQRDARVRIYGEGKDGERVTVSFKGQTLRTTVKAGAWEVVLEPMKADRNGAELRLACGREKSRLKDVLVGDVWVLGGQSNMYRGFNSYPPLKAEMEAMNQPLIRLFIVEPKRLENAEKRKTDFTIRGTGWTPVVYGNDEETQDFLKGMSPAGYFFAKNMVKEKGVPVGLLTACLGATSAQQWTPREVLEGNEALKQYLEPDGKGEVHASKLYNGVVYPITRFTVKGVLWYQGESNAKQAENYRILFPEMIKAWRKDFGRDELPFIFAQLASYDGVGWDQLGTSWAVLRESQTKALELPNTGMITLIDAGEKKDIHPANKQTAGYRFFMKARQLVFGEKIIADGPVFDSAQAEGGAMRITFSHVGGGLTVQQVSMPANNTSKPESRDDPIEWVRSPSDQLTGFSICGADQKFVPAEAKIISPNTVRVHAPEVPNPVAVRYAWANFSLANLYNKEGFPAEPFRTDSFALPEPEAFQKKKKR